MSTGAAIAAQFNIFNAPSYKKTAEKLANEPGFSSTIQGPPSPDASLTFNNFWTDFGDQSKLDQLTQDYDFYTENPQLAIQRGVNVSELLLEVRGRSTYIHQQNQEQRLQQYFRSGA